MGGCGAGRPDTGDNMQLISEVRELENKVDRLLEYVKKLKEEREQHDKQIQKVRRGHRKTC